MLVVFQSRSAPAALTTASGTAAHTAASNRSRSAAPRARPSPASHAIAASAAAPMPAMPGTFSVPPRRSRSCGPPITCGATRTPLRTQSAPMPFGPWNLCAAKLARSTGIERSSQGMRPTHCVASVWKRTPVALHSAPIPAIGCTAPVSLLAHITLTSAISGARASRISASCPRSALPAASQRSHTTSAMPRPASASHASRTALCSVFMVTSTRRPCWPCSCSACSEPSIASVAPSVPPLVKTISRSPAPTSRATDSRASSTVRRASIPARCTLDGLPHPRTSESVTAATTSGRGCVVALQSRYAAMSSRYPLRAVRRSGRIRPPQKATRAPLREPAVRQCG